MLNLTADNLPRVMQCNGSLLMNPENLPETGNPIRQEGIAAHWVIEQCYKTGQTPETFVDRKADNGVFISGDMVENLSEFLNTRHQNDKVEVEGSIGVKDVWQVNCRADRERRIINGDDDALYIDEFKYGFTIVEPEMNWTLLAHAFRFVLNCREPWPKRYVFTVYQPRPFHPKGKVRKWEIDFNELQRLYTLLGNTLSNPSDKLQTGNACRNCPALHGCPAAVQAAMSAIDVSLVAYTDNIKNEDLSPLLDTMKRAEKMLKQVFGAYEELAKHRLKSGQVVPNYSLERELSNRQWLPHVDVAFAHAMTGLDLSKKALITPAQAEKMGANPEIMKMLVTRTETGQKLARIDDKEKAKKLFNQPKGN